MTHFIRLSTLVLLGILSSFTFAQEDMSEAAQEIAEAQAEVMEAAREAQQDALEAAQEAQLEAQEAAQEAQEEALARQGEAIGLAAGKMAEDIVGNIRSKMPRYIGGMGGGWAGSSVPFADSSSTLIIPAQKTSSEAIKQIREDMRIMSQIWDDTVNPNTQQGWFSMHFAGGLFNTGAATSRIFIGDYGAVFLQTVDYPLIPTEQTETATQTKDPESDEVWQKAKKKIQGQPVEQEPFDKGAVFYDAEKVEALKEKCIKSFRHAANIRNLEPGQWVVLVIRYTPEDNVMPEEENAEPSVDNTSTLMLRAAKKDIDAFAKNPDNPEPFKKTVQILTY